MKHILDKGFKYTPSFDTDIKKRFDRIKREREEARKERAANAAEALAKVDERLLRRKVR